MISTIAFCLLIAAIILQIIYLLRDSSKPDPFSHFLLLAAGLLLFAAIIERSVKINFVAITNTYESLVFFSGAIAIVIFVYRVRNKGKALPFMVFGGTAIALILLALTSSPVSGKEIMAPIPALQSYWLVLHVSFAFVGEAFFAFSFVAAIYYLFVEDEEKKKRLDRMVYTSIGIGYPIYTAGGSFNQQDRGCHRM